MSYSTKTKAEMLADLPDGPPGNVSASDLRNLCGSVYDRIESSESDIGNLSSLNAGLSQTSTVDAINDVDDKVEANETLIGSFGSLDPSLSGATVVAVINDLFDKLSPIGTIMAFHKNLTGVPSLPGIWKECDGSAVSDADSPLNGQNVPNLNGDARFLRGASTSGTLQAASETVVYQDGNRADNSSWDRSTSTYSDGVTVTDTATGLIGGTPAGNTKIGKMRPINMSVVWVIRIK